MNLRSMEVLLAVAERKTLAATARQLDVSPAAVLQRLDTLEANVGTRLAFRGQGPIRLTPAGRLMADRAKGLMQAVELALQDTREAAKRVDGLVRLVAPIGTPMDIRAQILLELGQLHPELSFELIDTEDPLAHVDDPFDLMIHFGAPLETERFIERPIVRFPMGLMASPGYLKQFGSPQTVGDLERHRMLVWRPGQNTFKGLPGPDGQLLPCQPVLQSADMELVLEMAARGAGIAWCSLVKLGAADQRRHLVQVLAQTVTATMSGWLLCPIPSTLAPKNKALLESIMQELPPLVLK